MKLEKNSYQALLLALDQFKNKYYRVAAFKGIILLGLLGVIVLFSSIFLEGFFRFSSLGRGVLFFGSISLLSIILFRSVLSPFFKLLGWGNRMSYKNAALLIAKQTDGLHDQLINILELKSLENSQINDLIDASIEQKVSLVNKFDFLSSISLKDLRKYVVGFGVLLLFASFVSIKYSSSVLPPMERIIDFNNAFTPPNPFTFVVNNNKPLSVLENEDLTLQIKPVGPELPQDVIIQKQNQSLYTKKDSSGFFNYTFQSVSSNFSFYLIDGLGKQQSFNVEVLPKAKLISERKIVVYPNYTLLEKDTFTDLSSLIIPKGSKIYWNINTKNSSDCSIQFQDTAFAIKENQSNYQFYYQPNQNEEYLLKVSNAVSNHVDSLTNYIQVSEDLYPTISVSEIGDSVYDYFKFFIGEAEDDYGINSLSFVYKNKKTDSTKQLPVAYNRGNRAIFNFDFNFESLSLQPGDQIEYYFIVGDNDGINGSKYTQSTTRFINIPDKKEFKEKREQLRNKQQDDLSSLSSQINAIQQEMKEVKSSLLDKKKMDWNDQNRLRQLLKQQEQVNLQLENFKKELEKKLSFDPFKKDEEILQKQEQLQKIMKDLMSDEMKKLYDELNKLVQEMNKDKVLEKMEDIEFSQDNMIKELDRAIEHFKKLAVQEKAAEIKEQIEDLMKKQELLNEVTEDKKESLFEKTKKQEDIKDEFHEIQSDLLDLQEKNDALKQPENLDTEEKEKEVNETINESIEELNKNNLKKAAKNQKQTQQNLEELAQQLNGLMGNSQQQEQEDMETIRLLLEQLVNFSLDQEELLKQLKITNAQDPQFVKIGQEQRKLSDEILIIEDSLDALAMRQLMISNKINSEVQYIKRSLKKSIKNMTERKNNHAKREQQSVIMHTNELGLLLSEILNQMQQGMPGSGQCNKPGGNSKNAGKSLPQNADQLQKQIEAMKKYLKQKGNKKGPGEKGGGFEQLGRMAAEQAAIKKQLMEMAQQLNEDGSGKGNGLKKIIKDIEKVEEDIINNQLTQESILRQEEIKIKLLELDKATKEQEEDKKRESKEGKEEEKENNNNLYQDYLKMKQKETEMLKTIPPNLKPYYKNKVNEYFKNMDGI